MDELLPRINYLAKKAKAEGLSEEEKLEQAALRKKYLEEFKQNFNQVLLNTKVIDPKGRDITPKKLKAAKKKAKKNK